MITNFEYSFNPKTFTLYFKGKLLEHSQALDVLKLLDEYAQNKKIQHLHIDLSELEYINSSGLNILLQILTKVRKSGFDVYLINISEKVKQLLIVTKLNSVFNIIHEN